MNRKLIMLILPFLCLQSYGQDIAVASDSVSVADTTQQPVISADPTDYAALYEQEYRKFRQLEDSLEVIMIVKDNMQTENDSLQSAIKDKNAHLALKKQKLSKSTKELENSGVIGLRNKRDQLMSEVDSLNSDIDRLSHDLQMINEEIASLRTQRKELNSIKDEKSGQILDKYSSYLEQPLSVINISSLNEIIKECMGFTVDPKIKAFADRTEKRIGNKRIYDRAVKVVSSKFSRPDVQNSLKEISSIVEINADQQAEVDLVTRQLELFEEGVSVFKEFIQRLNAKRERVSRYSSSDFMDDLPYIMQNLQDRVEQSIMPVPYLKHEYTKYMDLIEKDPMQHPEIEQEILSL